ncbi:MAG: c-type cytochrome [Nitrospirae bacterium]|nr:c-type cytochrome [Nitrospirota bacterium]
MIRYISAIFIVLLMLLYGFCEDAKANAGDNPQGKKIYDSWCSQCHGFKGDGDSYTKDLSLPRPRDFSFGVFKFRSTPSGDPPTDADMTRVIRNGNPGTSMPPWVRFTDAEVKSIVTYVKLFAPDTFSMEAKPIAIGTPPKASADIIARGKELFKTAKCVECHGNAGRGNGEKGWQEKFKTDWGYPITPANYTQPWDLRNGSGIEDIYRTISVGIGGTPMTSYMDSLTDDKRWALAHYIKSLQLTRKPGVAVRVKKVEALPSSTDDPAWEKLEYLDLPMGGQLMFEPRNFTPVITNARVRGVYTDKEIAVMVEWSDKRPNKGGDNKPPDGVRIQLPSNDKEGSERPYFYMGSRKAPVELWQWQASDENGAMQLTAKGYDAVSPVGTRGLSAAGTYNDGLYRVIFKRAVSTGNEGDALFQAGRFAPFSVTLFDGQNGEEGNKGAISAWYFMMPEPPTPMRVYVFPPILSLCTLAAGIALHRRLRKKR